MQFRNNDLTTFDNDLWWHMALLVNGDLIQFAKVSNDIYKLKQASI